jgi:outer membrane lipoprotein carrier protein
MLLSTMFPSIRKFPFPRRLRPRRCLLAAALAMALAAGGAAPGFAQVQPANRQVPVEQFVQELEASYRHVRGLKAQFTQTYHWGAQTRTESGSVVFARGGRMRWEYHRPETKLFISNGKQVTLYLPAEKQATVSSLKGSEDYRVPFRLLLSRLDLKKFFEKIEDAPRALAAAPGDRVLRATPKHGDRSGIHQVVMEITPAFDICRLVIVYSDRTRMEFTFSDILRNPSWTPAEFEFQPPRGTEVIVQH